MVNEHNSPVFNDDGLPAIVISVYSVILLAFVTVQTGKMSRLLDELEMFALLIACLGHNIDHMGQSNSALLK